MVRGEHHDVDCRVKREAEHDRVADSRDAPKTTTTRLGGIPAGSVEVTWEVEVVVKKIRSALGFAAPGDHADL